MENKKEMTTPNVSAATDTEQPFPKCTEHSIADCDENIKSFEEMQREMLRQLSPRISKRYQWRLCMIPYLIYRRR